MGDAALGLDLGPPDAAMAEADPVLVQRFGDDDVLDAGGVEAALFGEVGDAAIAAGFLVGGGGDFDGAPEVGAGGDEGLGRDDRGGEAALHVAGAAAIDAVALDFGAEGIAGPAVADLDHVVMAVEMHAVAGGGAFAARDHVPARMGGAVAGRAFGADQIDGEAVPAEPFGEIFADFQIVAARWVERGDANQVLRQRDKVVAPLVDLADDPVVGCVGHGPDANAGLRRGQWAEKRMTHPRRCTKFFGK